MIMLQLIMSGISISHFCSLQRLFHVFQLTQVVQKHTLGEVGTWKVIWWPVVSEMFAQLLKSDSPSSSYSW